MTTIMRNTKDGSSQSKSVLLACKLCPEKVPANLMRCHVAKHLVVTPDLVKASTCGFCGLCDKGCTTTLKTTKKSIKVQSNSLLQPLSISYKAACKASSRSPSTNMPVKCDDCTGMDVFVWKYSMPAHYADIHPGVIVPPNFLLVEDEKQKVKNFRSFK